MLDALKKDQAMRRFVGLWETDVTGSSPMGAVGAFAAVPDLIALKDLADDRAIRQSRGVHRAQQQVSPTPAHLLFDRLAPNNCLTWADILRVFRFLDGVFGGLICD